METDPKLTELVNASKAVLRIVGRKCRYVTEIPEKMNDNDFAMLKEKADILYELQARSAAICPRGLARMIGNLSDACDTIVNSLDRSDVFYAKNELTLILPNIKNDIAYIEERLGVKFEENCEKKGASSRIKKILEDIR